MYFVYVFFTNVIQKKTKKMINTKRIRVKLTMI